MNYKTTTIVLALILVVTYAMHWRQIFDHDLTPDTTQQSTHQMPDGTMMHHDQDMMSMTMADMVTMLQGKTGSDLEKAFITGMIPHHQGAVNMAELLLQDATVRPELKAFAETIISAQQGEIDMMRAWLKTY